MNNVTINDRLAKIAVNKSLVKEFGTTSQRIVYLDNNSEFQIQLFNPYSYTIGATISLNGKEMSNRLVIKPGQRVWLERYLDSPNKFLFETYEVDGTPEAMAAIQKNGEVSVKFYKEQERVHYDEIKPFTWQNTYHYDDNRIYCGDTVKVGRSDVTTFTSLKSSDAVSNSLGFAPDCYDASNTAEAACKASVGSIDACYTSHLTAEVNYKHDGYATQDSVETGRVERGSHSNQEFGNVDIDFEWWPFKTEIIKILPTSRKPITNKDLNKIYCSNCGRKLNTKFKYCPYCGAKIEY